MSTAIWSIFATTLRSSSITITTASGCTRPSATSRRRSSNRPPLPQQHRRERLWVFSGMGRSTGPMGTKRRSRLQTAPQLIVPMSLRLIIPRRVALQQRSLLLHQPRVILSKKMSTSNEISVNGKCANPSLSQWRGSPHTAVANFGCPVLAWGVNVRFLSL